MELTSVNVNGLSPTRTNYGQYRNLVLGDEETSFVFGNQSSSYFYALPIERSRYKQSILPGTWTMNISGTQVDNELTLTDERKNLYIIARVKRERIFELKDKEIILSDFKLRFNSLDYFNEYIEYVNPKIIVTFSDNFLNYYKIIKIFFRLNRGSISTHPKRSGQNVSKSKFVVTEDERNVLRCKVSFIFEI